jgi:signal transduction histidine kinase
LDKLHARLEDSAALVEQTTGRIRNVMADLRPPVLDDYGLLAALRWHSERFAARTGIGVTVLGEDIAPRLCPAAENTLFRIVQEALTNVSKHAQAVQVTVTVEADDAAVRIVVADDGVGFDPRQLAASGERKGWGLLTMTERAEAMGGKLEVGSAPGCGARVAVEAPR